MSQDTLSMCIIMKFNGTNLSGNTYEVGNTSEILGVIR